MVETEIPNRFPIFPLPNVVLFPDSRLPLHIFEPRYREMLADVLAGDGVIGMVLLASETGGPEDPPPIFPVGCAGRVVHAERLTDGRSNIVLEGERRFRVLSEATNEKNYRIASVSLLPDPPYAALGFECRRELDEIRGELEHLLFDAVEQAAPDNRERLRESIRELDSVQLLNALAAGLDCDVLEKQSLLEAPDPLSRANLLCRVIDLRRAESAVTHPSREIN